VAVRAHGDGQQDVISVEAFIEKMQAEREAAWS